MHDDDDEQRFGPPAPCPCDNPIRLPFRNPYTQHTHGCSIQTRPQIPVQHTNETSAQHCVSAHVQPPAQGFLLSSCDQLMMIRNLQPLAIKRDIMLCVGRAMLDLLGPCFRFLLQRHSDTPSALSHRCQPLAFLRRWSRQVALRSRWLSSADAVKPPPVNVVTSKREATYLATSLPGNHPPYCLGINGQGDILC